MTMPMSTRKIPPLASGAMMSPRIVAIAVAGSTPDQERLGKCIAEADGDAGDGQAGVGGDRSDHDARRYLLDRVARLQVSWVITRAPPQARAARAGIGDASADTPQRADLARPAHVRCGQNGGAEQIEHRVECGNNEPLTTRRSPVR